MPSSTYDIDADRPNRCVERWRSFVKNCCPKARKRSPHVHDPPTLTIAAIRATPDVVRSIGQSTTAAGQVDRAAADLIGHRGR